MNLDLMLVLFQAVVLVFAISVHGCVQAYATMRLGDATAFMVGRVTLNPAKHIDPWGTVAMPALSFLLGGSLVGWGRPVPVTLRNFKRIKRDDIVSTLAAMGSFLGMAFVALILLVLLKHTHGVGEDAVFAAMGLAKKMDVDTTALPRLFPVALLLYYCVVMNVLLFVFNMIPVPPLDGGRVVRYFLPYNVEQYYDRIGMLGSFLIFFVAGRIVFPIFYPPLLRTFDGLLVRL